MNFHYAPLAALFPLCLSLAGCASGSDDAEGAEQAATVERFRLPASDKCRQVLLPLAKGVAASSVGLDFVEGVDVKLTSETDVRDYLVEVDGKDFTVSGHVFSNKYEFAIELSNDSSFGCFLQHITVTPNSSADGKTTPATAAEVAPPNFPLSLPPGDACKTTLQYLAEGAALSSVGPGRAEKVVVTLTSKTEDRDYDVLVDGKSFAVDGHTFTNDFKFKFNLSNDSSFGCLVQDIKSSG
jgi:hypothetical protein